MSVLAIALAFAFGLVFAGPAARPTDDGGGSPTGYRARWVISGLVRLLLVVLVVYRRRCGR